MVTLCSWPGRTAVTTITNRGIDPCCLIPILALTLTVAIALYRAWHKR